MHVYRIYVHLLHTIVQIRTKFCSWSNDNLQILLSDAQIGETYLSIENET